MTRRSVTDTARLRLKLCGAAALMLLCSACGDGIPKDEDDEDGGESPPPQAALSILAGDPTIEGTMDGAGTAARFKWPQGIAIDADDNLYVADTGNFVIRKITPAGVVTTVAGAAGTSGFVDGDAGNARFGNPVAVAVNRRGTIYVADNLRIRSITSAGRVSTTATIPIDMVHAAVQHKVVVALRDEVFSFRDLIFVIVRKFGVRCWKGRVNVLRRGLMLSGTSAFQGGHVSLFKRPVLIERSADKIGAVGQFRTWHANVDRS